jgi:hypothetical protein
MTKIKKWRIYCETEGKYIEDSRTWYEHPHVPSKCPNDTVSHTISLSRTLPIEEKSDNVVKVQEEVEETGGIFQAHGIELVAAPNDTTVYPYFRSGKFSALAVDFTTDETHAGDVVNIYGLKNKTVGVLTAGANPGTVWQPQNYVVGDIVTQVHPNGIFGERTYTCIKNTTSQQSPISPLTGEIDIEFWEHGFELNVSSTVTPNIKNGFEVRLVDGGHVQSVGDVTAVDKINNKIYVETNVDGAFGAGTTYVQASALILKNSKIGNVAWKHSLGEEKIGGSPVRKDQIIYIEYTNNSGVQKNVVGDVSMLY